VSATRGAVREPRGEGISNRELKALTATPTRSTRSRRSISNRELKAFSVEATRAKIQALAGISNRELKVFTASANAEGICAIRISNRELKDAARLYATHAPGARGASQIEN